MQLNHHLFELDRLWVFRINVHGQIGFRARTIDFIQYYLVEPVPIEGKVEHGLKLGQDVLRSHVSVGRGTGWFARRRGVRLVYCLSVDSSLGDLCSVIVATSDRSVSLESQGCAKHLLMKWPVQNARDGSGMMDSDGLKAVMGYADRT